VPAVTASDESVDAARRTVPALDAGAGVAPLRILLVEDNATNQMLVLHILGKEGHELTVANNGKEALEKLRIPCHRASVGNSWEGGSAGSAPECGIPFDLVLMDVQMPEMDGLEATALIRAHERGTGLHLPILAMTAHAMKGDREECLAKGMDGYLSKPIQAAELRRAIGTVMRHQVIAVEPVPEARAEATASAINRSAALEVAGGDVQLLKKLAESFLHDCPGLLSAVRAAVTTGDGKALHRAAHTLKGAVNMFGAQAAWDQAQRLEQLGRDGDFARATEALADLEREIERVVQELSALVWEERSERISQFPGEAW
jgi:CheY-like chemotaxis protein